MEDANYDMSSAMIGHQADFDLAFDALCLGIDRVSPNILFYFQILIGKELISTFHSMHFALVSTG
jgi:hypothetical protein